MTTYVPSRIAIAPSGFKESLSAVEVADAIAAGLRRVLPGVVIDKFPVPDGGEGTVEILSYRRDAEIHRSRVQGPCGDTLIAEWVMLSTKSRKSRRTVKTAVLEMASAAGLSKVPRDLRNPAATTTYGVGELIVAAIDAGAAKIVVGCGDSGTCDGGAGALAALGAKFFTGEAGDIEIENIVGEDLEMVTDIDIAELDSRLNDVELELACNIHNVLSGANGVARVFGPQKGATPQQVESLDRGLTNLAMILDKKLSPNFDLTQGPGSGASGGLGSGLAAIGAQPRDRFEVFLSREFAVSDSRAAQSATSGEDQTNHQPTSAAPVIDNAGEELNFINDHSSLDSIISRADLVITAEGAIDFQTPKGKVPAEIASRSSQHGVPVLAIAGSLGRGAPRVHDVGIDAITSIMTVPMPLEDAVRNGWNLLADAAERTMRLLILGSAMAGQIARKQ